MTKISLVAAAAAAMLMAVPAVQAQQQQQEGLVNIALQNTTIAVPVGIAAQVCGVDIGVIQDARNKNTTVDCKQADVNNPALENFRNSNAGGNKKS